MLSPQMYKQYSVLFVDDEELALITFQRLFKEELTVYTAEDGEEALQVIRAHPDIVVLVTDQRMPKVTGIELIKSVSQEHPQIITILITAYLDANLIAEAMSGGHLYRAERKPYDPKILKDEIIQAIEQYHLMKERDRLFAEHIGCIKELAKTQRLAATSLLAAGVTNDINNAISAVNAFYAMLPESGPPDDNFWRKFYSVSGNQVENISKIIHSLYGILKSREKEGPVK